MIAGAAGTYQGFDFNGRAFSEPRLERHVEAMARAIAERLRSAGTAGSVEGEPVAILETEAAAQGPPERAIRGAEHIFFFCGRNVFCRLSAP